MKSYGIEAIRNVGLFGHQGSGKTSLAEALLYTSGALDRLGRVDDGAATTDFDPEEQPREEPGAAVDRRRPEPARRHPEHPDRDRGHEPRTEHGIAERPAITDLHANVEFRGNLPAECAVDLVVTAPRRQHGAQS